MRASKAVPPVRLTRPSSRPPCAVDSKKPPSENPLSSQLLRRHRSGRSRPCGEGFPTRGRGRGASWRRFQLRADALDRDCAQLLPPAAFRTDSGSPRLCGLDAPASGNTLGSVNAHQEPLTVLRETVGSFCQLGADPRQVTGGAGSIESDAITLAFMTRFRLIQPRAYYE